MTINKLPVFTESEIQEQEIVGERAFYEVAELAFEDDGPRRGVGEQTRLVLAYVFGLDEAGRIVYAQESRADDDLRFPISKLLRSPSDRAGYNLLLEGDTTERQSWLPHVDNSCEAYKKGEFIVEGGSLCSLGYMLGRRDEQNVEYSGSIILSGDVMKAVPPIRRLRSDGKFREFL